jgi:hypothetical protein
VLVPIRTNRPSVLLIPGIVNIPNCCRESTVTALYAAVPSNARGIPSMEEVVQLSATCTINTELDSESD